ncbi:hypothetical protein D9M71_83570 [compost metagenome]
MPRTGKAEHHPRGGVELAVHRRDRRHQDHEVDQARRAGDAHLLHHGDEWTLGPLPRLVPGHHREDQRQGENVEHHQPHHGHAEGILHRHFRLLRLTGRHRDHLNTEVAEDGDDDGDPDT